jgi:inosine-uridine nucleoside N-ribohydrolase
MKNKVTPFSRRWFLFTSALATGAFASPNMFASRAFGASPKRTGRIPVVLATDIGGDIDDTWALALLLKSPELELKLALTDYGSPQYRAKLLAKFLETAGHGNIPVGLGPEYGENREGGQAAWVKDYHLDHYRGTLHENGAKALVETIMSSPQPITLISVGPTPTVAAALAMEPKIAERARFVGMHGSVRVGYDGSATPAAETNVVAAVKPAQQVLSASWDITITPLDTCGLVILDGARYQRLLKSRDPLVSALIENYRIWSRSGNGNPYADLAEKRSSVLFDTVAVYLAMFQDLCVMERLNIRVTDDGFTKIDGTGKSMKVATAWRNLEAYKDFLVNRLLAKG